MAYVRVGHPVHDGEDEFPYLRWRAEPPVGEELDYSAAVAQYEEGITYFESFRDTLSLPSDQLANIDNYYSRMLGHYGLLLLEMGREDVPELLAELNPDACAAGIIFGRQAFHLHSLDRASQARTYATQARSLYVQCDDDLNVAWMDFVLALSDADEGSLDAAETRLRSAIVTWEPLRGSRAQAATARHLLANVLRDQGRTDEARRTYLEALQGYEAFFFTMLDFSWRTVPVSERIQALEEDREKLRTR